MVAFSSEQDCDLLERMNFVSKLQSRDMSCGLHLCFEHTTEMSMCQGSIAAGSRVLSCTGSHLASIGLEAGEQLRLFPFEVCGKWLSPIGSPARPSCRSQRWDFSQASGKPPLKTDFAPKQGVRLQSFCLKITSWRKVRAQKMIMREKWRESPRSGRVWLLLRKLPIETEVLRKFASSTLRCPQLVCFASSFHRCHVKLTRLRLPCTHSRYLSLCRVHLGCSKN